MTNITTGEFTTTDRRKIFFTIADDNTVRLSDVTGVTFTQPEGAYLADYPAASRIADHVAQMDAGTDVPFTGTISRKGSTWSGTSASGARAIPSSVVSLVVKRCAGLAPNQMVG